MLTVEKLSKCVVVLFPPNIQQMVDFMLNITTTINLVPLQNKYLFAYAGGVHDNWTKADIAMRRLAYSTGLFNPVAISSNKL